MHAAGAGTVLRETITEPETPPSAGSPYTISCTIGAPGAAIEWTGPDGNLLMSSDRITIAPSMTVGQTTTSSVTFNPLNTEDTGRYTCSDDQGQTTTTIITQSK